MSIVGAKLSSPPGGMGVEPRVFIPLMLYSEPALKVYSNMCCSLRIT